MSNILIGTNVHKTYHRQDLCIESLKKLQNQNKNVNICLIQEQQDIVEYDNIDILFELKRNSSDCLKTTKRLPFVNDIFNSLCDHSTDYFVFVNSDIIVSQPLIDLICSTDVEAFAVSRIDIPFISTITTPFKPIRMEPAGFDCWIFSKKWWLSHKHLFEDYLLGRPYFDVHYAMLMFLNSKNLFISNKHLIYHILHEKTSFIEDECYNFNKSQTNKYYASNENIWGECCNNTFWKRKDLGTFLQFNNNENDILLSIQQQFKK